MIEVYRYNDRVAINVGAAELSHTSAATRYMSHHDAFDFALALLDVARDIQSGVRFTASNVPPVSIPKVR